ncbi:MAG: thioredoxin family protein [Sediminibacterium sp.]|jgi:thioredoxin-related protein
MRLLFSIFCFLFISNLQWSNNYDQAIQAAKKEHKFILLNFSGSDWCGPCIKLHKEVFTTEKFEQLANEKLILVNADFPRYKKNQLALNLQKSNDALAEKYNNKGVFPLTVLINSEGIMIKSWEGFPPSTFDFIDDIAQTIQDQQK